MTVEYYTRCCCEHGEMQLKTKSGQVVHFTGLAKNLTVASVATLVHGETAVVANYEVVCPAPWTGCICRELHSLSIPNRDAPPSSMMSL